MRVSDELLEATRSNEPLAQDMVNIWSHSAYAHYPSNPGPGFWVIGENLRLMQRQKPGVMHVDFAACNNYANGATAAAKRRLPCPARARQARHHDPAARDQGAHRVRSRTSAWSKSPAAVTPSWPRSRTRCWMR